MLKDNGIDYSCAKLSEEELQAEYFNASLLLCSTLEGYGMPIIEAQTIGVPSSPATGLPWNGGWERTALPIRTWRHPHGRSSSPGNEPPALINAGHANAKACSAARSAELHAELYRPLLDPA